MVRKLKCDCNERVGVSINSIKLFTELKKFFEGQIGTGLFEEEENKEPYYIWIDKDRSVKYCATKWYRCKDCGCLWEFNYPDFPAKGFVRKYEHGIYTGTEIVDRTKSDTEF